VAGGIHAQRADHVRGDALPVGAEQRAGAFVEHQPADGVALAGRHGVEVGDQQPGHPVGGEHVGAAAQDHRRAVAQLFHQGEQPRAYGLSPRRPAAPHRSRPPGDGAKVFTLGRIEPERGRDGVENGLRGCDRPALLEADVVVDAHAGQRRQFLAAWSG
jgi:hypothetical protein